MTSDERAGTPGQAPPGPDAPRRDSGLMATLAALATRLRAGAARDDAAGLPTGATAPGGFDTAPDAFATEPGGRAPRAEQGTDDPHGMRGPEAGADDPHGMRRLEPVEPGGPAAWARRAAANPFRVGFLGGLGVLLAYVTYQVVASIRSTLIVIAIAAVLAIGLDPAVRFFIRRGMRRGLAVLTVFLILLGALAGAFYAIIPPIVTEVAALVKNLPQMIAGLQNNPTLKDLDSKFGLLKAIQDSSLVKDISSGAFGGLLTAAGVAFDVFVVLILTLYFLAGFPRIKTGAYRLAPASRRPRVAELGDRILQQMGGYLSGATIIAVQAGIVAGVFAAIVGLPYPWAIALGAAVLDFLPIIGPVIIGVSMTLIGFTESLTIGIVAGAFYVCQHLFEAYWLYPKVMRRTVHITAGAVVVAILIGAALLGVIGALLAVPVAAALQLIVREVWLSRQDKC